MDIRIEKTEKAIKSAFIELRSQKPLEKITIKELCRLACINKSTFYSHYDDIYALSESLELETVNSVLNSIQQNKDYALDDPATFTKEFCLAFAEHLPLINILFSGKEQGRLANHLETVIKEAVFQKYPEYVNDIEKNVLLSYLIQGAYHAYLNNQSVDVNILIKVIENIAKTLQPLY